MQYRPDIDGLRAIAIVPVVLFHAGLPGFSGGYVGVDVFFVVSGFLITSLIWSEIQGGQFSIAGFYERRIRRIFPALFWVLACVSCAALWILSPGDLKRFADSVIATALFGSNVLFWTESGYFDAPAEWRPLLHTWSLAVEEQFYIAFPLLMVLLSRYGRRALLVSLGGLALLSFGWGALQMAQAPTAVFFLSPFRTWELMLGALAALGCLPAVSNATLRTALAAGGLALIAGSVVFYTEHTPFPGFHALIPCLGALLVIHAGDSGPHLISRMLSYKPVVFIGLISYSLYLWHWPILVLARHGLGRELEPVQSLPLIALSTLMAVVSWRYVERPFRRRGTGFGTRAQVLRGGLLAITLAVLVGLLLPAGSATEAGARLPPPSAIGGPEEYRKGECFLSERQTHADWRATDCVIQGTGPQRWLLWGDSFAAHLVPGLVHTAPTGGPDIVQFTAYACPPVLGAEVSWAPQCRGINDHIDVVLDRGNFDGVILAAHWARYWPHFVDGPMLERTLARLKARGLPVLLVGQGPTFSFADPVQFVSRQDRRSDWPLDHRELNRTLQALAGIDLFFNPHEILCERGRCPIIDDQDYRYWDPGHLSSHGSRLVAEPLLRDLSLLSARRAVPAIAPGPR